MRKRSWENNQLKESIAKSKSYRQVLFLLGLKEAGGNYSQVKKYIKELDLDISHFSGKAWNKGLKHIGKPRIKIEDILIKNSNFQSFKLKKRLFNSEIKRQECEECGWSKRSEDGRTPLELHHENGDSRDNRIENLKILCPNCHSLKSNHRGRNIKKR